LDIVWGVLTLVIAGALIALVLWARVRRVDRQRERLRQGVPWWRA
jgi:hypothetical protein